MKKFGHKLVGILEKSKDNVIYFFKNNILDICFQYVL